MWPLNADVTLREWSRVGSGPDVGSHPELGRFGSKCLLLHPTGSVLSSSLCCAVLWSSAERARGEARQERSRGPSGSIWKVGLVLMFDQRSLCEKEASYFCRSIKRSLMFMVSKKPKRRKKKDRSDPN
ncbi:hypothetical protein CRG98_028859 [Punica granatum]|uniref:Uncharacterized protein n=1 Tax=Punica granatum TaxID=22663 RepID=A0A2I0J3A3_PUNGR|nr:hypothetical protein CRG98_028859 [Punica granatum]